MELLLLETIILKNLNKLLSSTFMTLLEKPGKSLILPVPIDVQRMRVKGCLPPSNLETPYFALLNILKNTVDCFETPHFIP